MVGLEQLVGAFAAAFRAADGRMPQHVSRTTGRVYQPGLGPHSENAAMALTLAELDLDTLGLAEAGQFAPYPNAARQKCDLWFGLPPQWVVEVKMARFRGDNGKPDDTSLKDLLSPYPSDRSALTDWHKLAASGFPCQMALLVYGFDYPDRSLDPAIDALEALARRNAVVGERIEANIGELVHPVHSRGRMFAWEITPAQQR